MNGSGYSKVINLVIDLFTLRLMHFRVQFRFNGFEFMIISGFHVAMAALLHLQEPDAISQRQGHRCPSWRFECACTACTQIDPLLKLR
jgi:hypothetical protein